MNYKHEDPDGFARQLEARCRFYRRQCDCNPMNEYPIDEDQYFEDDD